MRTFKVIADTCGSHNKIYNCNDTVKESDFKPGIADSLVRRQFLREIMPKETPPVTAEQLQGEDEPLQDGKKETLMDLRNDTPKETPPEALPDDMSPTEEIVTENNNPEEKRTVQLEEKNIANALGAISVDQIVHDLKENAIPFDANSTKEELYKLWLLI